jgi:non-specific serine/threonine protein kinase
MAYVDGERLTDKVKRGPLKLEEAIEIALHIAQGLQAAHEKGIVHRDIKSANVMLTSSGQVKVMDFGLAKLAGTTAVTREGTTLGTAGYMSPEQARGEAADSRTDIWSLGVVLYEMLTGRLPFSGEYEQALIYQILNGAPDPITSVRSGVPMELERIVTKCLEKNRDERYQNAADLIADFRHLQRAMGAGSEASGRSMARDGRPARRVRWLYWTIPLVVAAIVAVIVFFRMPRRAVPPEEKSIAVLPFVDMSPQHDQEYFCDGMTEELIDRLANIQGLRVPARTSAFTFKGKTEDIPEIGSKLNVRTVLEGSVRKAGNELRITAQLINVADGYHLWSETYDRKLEDVFAIQDEISSAIVNALQLKLTPQEAQKISEHPIGNVKAYEYYLKADREVMRFDEKSLDSALVYLQTAIDIMGDNAELFSAMANVYSQYVNLGVKQEDYLEKAREYAMKALALRPDLSSALCQLANLDNYEDYPKNILDSYRYYERALVANPTEIRALHGMAAVYEQVGKPPQALVFVERMERQDPLNPRRYIMRGYYCLYDCQFGPAQEQFDLLRRADPTSPLAQSSYAWLLACNGKRDEAIALIDQMGKGSSSSVMTVFSLLLKYGLLNDRESALRLITPDFRKTCSRDFEWSYWVASRLSLAGAKSEALDWLEHAVDRGFINYPFLGCDPFLNNIRGEERYKKIMERAKYEWEHFEVPK